MGWLRNLRLSTRLIGSFVVLCGITAFLGVFALTRLSTVHVAAPEVELKR
jgi:hypothetical protein